MTRRSIEDVDVLLETPLDHTALVRTCLTLDSEGLTLRVASIDDLIEMKLQARREQDYADIEALRRLKDLEDG